MYNFWLHYDIFVKTRFITKFLEIQERVLTLYYTTRMHGVGIIYYFKTSTKLRIRKSKKDGGQNGGQNGDRKS